MKTINNLVIETTRRCNMACEHCLRGDAENMDIKNDYISALLLQVEYISNVTFSGGEPSLNVPAIEHFIAESKRLGVSIGSFYIATNGKAIKDDFILTCVKLYAMSDEKEVCQVHVSNDQFHAAEDGYNTELLDGLAFFSRKFDDEGHSYNNGEYLIAEGRGADFGNRENTESKIEDLEDLEDATLYLNSKGKVINGCDWSFETQDNGDYELCSVYDLGGFLGQFGE